MIWRRALLLCLAAGMLAAVVFLQTGAGFRRVIVPLFDDFLDAELSVRAGRLRWTGTVAKSATERSAAPSGEKSPGVAERVGGFMRRTFDLFGGSEQETPETGD